MLNTTTAKPLLIEIDRQIANRSKLLDQLVAIAKNPSNPDALEASLHGYDIASHIGELKELRYQLSMTPERVTYINSNDSTFPTI